ncbi:MAG: hypothetical protein WAV46_04745 [Candidatus Moraniibacteriota bacterium]
MQKTNTKKMGTASALFIAILSFGAFASMAAVVAKDHSLFTPLSLAKDGEEDSQSDDNNGDEDESKDEDQNDDGDKDEKSGETAKKQAERQREDAKKQLERSNKSFGVKDGSTGDSDQIKDEEDEDGAKAEGADENENGEANGMFKDQNKTLAKLNEKLDEAAKYILEKQAEGENVATALARLALAKAKLFQVNASFDTNDFETAKALAKEIKKEAHFTEKDLEFAKKASEAVAKVTKRFGQIDKKIAELETLGGDATAFKTALASLEQDFAVLQAAAATAPDTMTRDTVRAFENKVKRLKSLVEQSIFALGGTEDDDLSADHEQDSDDLVEDLKDVADIEDGDDNGVSGKVRRVAAEHKAAVQAIAESLKNIQGRDGVTRALFGPDFSALDSLNAEIAAMNIRATALESASAQIADPEIKKILVDRVTALRDEAAKLQSYIAAEGNQFSLFGKLISFFR